MNQFTQIRNKVIQTIILTFMAMNFSGCTALRVFYYQNHPEEISGKNLPEFQNRTQFVDATIESSNKDTIKHVMDLMSDKIKLVLFTSYGKVIEKN